MAKLTVEDLNRLREELSGKNIFDKVDADVKITVHMGTCGIAAGAMAVMDALSDEISLTDRKDIYIMSSGCMGMCSSEPNITVEVKGKGNVLYQHVDKNKMRQIFKRHILKGEIQSDFALAKF